jgi:small-conductance mechanosensitive channel
VPQKTTILGYTFEDNTYLLIAAVVFLIVWMVIGVTLKAIVFSYIKRWTAKTATRIDDLVTDALNFPTTLLIFASGLMVLVRLGISTEYVTHQQLYNALLIVGILSIVLFADRALRGAITTYSDRIEVFRMAGGLVQSCVRAAVLIIGLLVLLGTLGINITPLIASLGVGSLAVALALQPTLENFFAGVQVISDRQIMEGQFIRLESGEEGFVHKINMRSTWLRTLQGNMIAFPNKLLVTTRIMNYHYPEKDVTLPVPLGVHYDSDMAFVEAVTTDVARQVQAEVEGAVRGHEPVFRIQALADSSINFTVGLKLTDTTCQGIVRHEFYKRILARFRKERIVIPYPIRALNVSQEKAEMPKVA